MACHLFIPSEAIIRINTDLQWNVNQDMQSFVQQNAVEKYHRQIVGHFVQTLIC